MPNSIAPSQGYSLLQLLIALLLFSLFATLALPNYQTAMRQSARSAAKAELLRLADLQAQWRLSHTQYGTLAEIQAAAPTIPYQFAVTVNSNQAFSITATPATDAQQHDDCGILQVTQDIRLSSQNPQSCPNP